MVFLVKEELEEYLDKESRDITMPDGSIRSFTYFALTWTYFDHLINFTDSYTEEKLADMGVRNAEETGISIEKSFHDVIGYTYHHFKEICGANIDERIIYIEQVLKNLEGKAQTQFNLKC